MSDSSTEDFETRDGGKRQKSKAANREAIMASAAKVFSELGFQAATVRDIVRGTDLAAGTFYNYFKSKEDVYEALEDHRSQRILPGLRAASDDAQSFEQFMRVGLGNYYKFLVEAYGDV